MLSAVPPEAMTPAERLSEVAAILARGVIRLRLHSRAWGGTPVRRAA